MKTDRRSVVLASSLAPAAGTLRGHRSLGDENLTLTGAAGKRQGTIQDKTNINSRGWKYSTRTSPIWKQKSQENKENTKLPVPKKFQHVQSKLAAPVFSQRRSKQTAAGDVKTGPAFDEGPLHDSPAVLNVPAAALQLPDSVCGITEEPRENIASFPNDQFVTKRCHGQLPEDFPVTRHELLVSSFSPPASPTQVEGSAPGLQEVGRSVDRPLASPVLRQTPHPSVSALYQFAHEVRTPLSRTAKSAASGAPSDCVNMLLALESAAQGLEPEASPEELTDSFGSWLTSMGMDEEALSGAALAKMQALWHKAKEAVRLQALVEQLKEEELQLARQQADESARQFDSLLAENKDLAGQTACMQQQLLEAEERLVRLALSHTPADDAVGSQVAEATSTRDAAAAQVDSPIDSTASIALWAQASYSGSKRSSESPVETRFSADVEAAARHDGLLKDAAGLQQGADSSPSISLGSQVQPCFSSTSAFVGGPLPSPSSCASFVCAMPAADAPAATPGLSVISHAPEAVPFTTWLAGVDGAASSAAIPGAQFGHAKLVASPAAAATPDGAMPSPGAVLSPPAAASGLEETYSVQRSAGLSAISRPAQPVAFAAWATFAEKVQTPSGPTEMGTKRQIDSPAPSHGVQGASSVGAEASPASQVAGTPMWPVGGAAPAGLPTDKPQTGPGTPVDMSPAPVSPTPFGKASVGDSMAAGAAAAPNFSAAQGRYVFVGSPQLSAGLSVISKTPQAMAYNVWATVQRVRAEQTAAAAMQTTPSQSTPGPYGSASPLSSVGFETVSKPEVTSAGSTPLNGATSGAHATPAAHLRSNPLFEIDSPASCMSTLPERADAMGGLAATPSPARSQPAPPSLASTPMSDFSQELRSNLTSPMVGEAVGSPGVQLFDGCSPGLFSPDRFGLGDMPSPAAAAPMTATHTGAPASPCHLEAVSPAAGAGDVGRAEEEQSPIQCEVSFVEAAVKSPDGAEPCSPFPGEAIESSPYCATPPEVPAGAAPTAGPTGDVCDARAVSSPKDISSPAANSVITTKFIASPDVDSRVVDGGALRVETALQPAGDILINASTGAEADQQGDTPEDARAERQSSAAFWDQGSPEAATAAQAQAPHSNAVAPDELAVTAAAAGDGSSHSYPNTPSAAWPASPTTTVYATPLEAFSEATPTSLASFCSAIRLTAMRMRGELSTPDGQGVQLGSITPANFTFGFGSRGQHEAPTPILGLGMPAAADASATAGGFGSPMPMVQLTPVQLRALDQLAGHVIAALSPVCKPAAPGDRNASLLQPTAAAQVQPVPCGDAQQPMNAAASVTFNLSQLLAQLRSPLPAPVHHRSRFAPSPPQPTAAPAGSQGSAAKQHDELAGMSVSSSPSCTRVAGPVDTEPPAASDAAPAPMPASSPMPNFGRLMAFLNAGTRGPIGQSGAGAGVADASGSQGKPMVAVISDNEAGDAGSAAAAAFNLAHLLAQLHSPMPNQAVARPVEAAAGFGSVDSPVAACGAHDSPASEAASFGFSTAAKAVQTRPTPGTTPGGGGVSFMRWAQETGPPSFRLDSDARHTRGRLSSRTPPTPMSFSFGGPFGVLPIDEEGATPGVGNGAPKGGRIDNGPSPAKLLDLKMSPEAPGSGQERADAGAKPVGSVASLRAGVQHSPCMSFSFHAAAAASPAFSFGPQLGMLPAGASTPTAPFGPGDTQDRAAPTAMQAAQSAVRSSMPHCGGSPAVSLGVWGYVPLDTEARAAGASRAPSERAFTFDNLASSLMATPVWPGLNGCAAPPELVAERQNAEFVRDISAALDQFAMAASSPTLFGMAAQGSPQDTPGVTQRAPPADLGAVASPQADACVPATAVLWTALLAGALHSPMPAAMHARAQRGTSQAQQQQPIAPFAAMAAPSLDTMRAAGSVNASSAGSVAGAEAPALASAAIGPQAESAAMAPSATSGAQAEAPPPYDDLPDLIARGLCLNASTPGQASEADLAAGAAVDTCCSSIGENPTPQLVRRTEAPNEPAFMAVELVGDAAPSAGAGSPSERLFQPVRPLAAAGSFALDDSPPGLGELGSGQQLVVESICGSNGSGSLGAALPAVQAGRTTEEPVPTPSRLAGPEMLGTCNNLLDAADEDSVHSSPVFSFHVASECSASPGSPVPVTGATAACTEAAVPCADSSEVTSHYDTASSPVINMERSQPDESPAFSLDAVPHLLFGAGAASTASVAGTQPTAVAAATAASPHSEAMPVFAMSEENCSANAAGSSGTVPQDAEAPAPHAAASQAGSALAPEAGPDAALLNAAAPVSVMSPAPSKGRVCEGPTSPLTFSYLGTGTPPSTPPTAELASTGRAGVLFGHPRVSPRSSGGGQFWAPSPSGPSAALGDRVTLEASNRRIRANADLLLDFQVSSVAPADAAKPVIMAPKEASAPAQAAALTGASRVPVPYTTDGFTAGAAARVPAVPAGGRDPAEPALAGPLNLALQPGPGPRLQQLVATGIEQTLASAMVAVPQHSGMPMWHMPISQRMGLWAAPAWGVPCSAPLGAAPGLPVSAAQVPSTKPEPVPAQPVKSPQQTKAPGKPVLTSRDVQTTPGLVKSQSDYESQALVAPQAAASMAGGSAPPQLPPMQPISQAPDKGANGARKPAFRSRIPVPGGLPAPPARAVNSGGPQVSAASTAASSDDEAHSSGQMATSAGERVVRRGRLLTCAAAAAGPQRVLVKRGTQQHSVAQEAGEVATLGEEEMRRRARILGMRISPYLRAKPSKVRAPEVPKGSKG